MSRLQKVLNELNQITNQVGKLIECEKWDMIESLLEMIMVFGNEIGSNGIQTHDDINQLQKLSKENPILFSNVLFDNLQLLTEEYKQLINYEGKDNIVSPFNYGSLRMALIKKDKNQSQFVYETDEMSRIVIQKIPLDTDAVILIGYGSGFLHEKLADHYSILTIEPHAIINDLGDDSIIYSPMYLDKKILQSKLQKFTGLKTEIITHPLYEDSEHIVRILKSVRNFLQEIQIDLRTRVLYTEKWYKEIFSNAKYLRKQTNRIINVDNLKKQYTKKSALIIAGGPSLEEALPYLKRVQKNYFIIAIGQTVKVLLDHDVTPDFIISIDTSDANTHFFNDLEITIPLVYSLQVNHKIPQKAKGLLIPYADIPLAKNLLRYSKISFGTSPTVALAAVEFANYLGFDFIGLIGQDLALREGEYYSESVKKVSSNNGQLSNNLYDVPLNNGEIGKTTPVLLNFLSGYQSLIKLHPNLKNKLVNYSEKGAVIDNVPYCSLNTLYSKEIIKEHLKIDKIISDNEIPIEDVLYSLNSISDYLKFLKKRLYRIVQQKAITINEFEKVLRDWDKMIEAPFFRTHIMPLQLVNLLIIQNKIKVHNTVRKHSDVRLHILNLMRIAIDELILQLENIQENTIEV